MERVFIAGAEIFPFAKVGGLADVLGALPRGIADAGIDVRLIMPFYGNIKENRAELESEHKVKFVQTGVKDFPVSVGEKTYTLTLWQSFLPKIKIPVYFVENSELFDRKGIYSDENQKPFPDEDVRLVFFNKCILESAKLLGFRPEVIHLNDYHTALVPAYLKLAYSSDAFFEKTATVLTIHNIKHQGIFPKDVLEIIGLGRELFYPTGPFEFYDKVNFFKIGIVFADAVSTVSPTYALQIQTSDYGERLDGLLRALSYKVFGILNGVDYQVWDPKNDAVLKKYEATYSSRNLSGKVKAKHIVLRKFNFPEEDMETPVMSMISRTDPQKGLDILIEAIPEIMKLNARLILLLVPPVAVFENYRTVLFDYERKYGGRISVTFEANEELAHLVEAGSDMFLMPSKFEPCGLNQMYSLRYGTVPVVRHTGGLADTVIDVDEHPDIGTGFVFYEYSSQALLSAIRRALNAYLNRDRWQKIVLRGMEADFSWYASARKYIDMYNKAVEFRKKERLG